MTQNLKNISLLFLLAALTAFSTNGFSEPIRVIAVDFTSSVGTNYTRRLPELIVDELVNSGDFDVLEREKLTSMARELDFQGGALVAPSRAVQIGSMSGALRVVFTLTKEW